MQSTSSLECSLLTTTGTSGCLVPSWPSLALDMSLWNSRLRSSLQRTCAMHRTPAGVPSKSEEQARIWTAGWGAASQSCSNSGAVLSPWQLGRARSSLNQCIEYTSKSGWHSGLIESSAGARGHREDVRLRIREASECLLDRTNRIRKDSAAAEFLSHACHDVLHEKQREAFRQATLGRAGSSCSPSRDEQKEY